MFIPSEREIYLTNENRSPLSLVQGYILGNRIAIGKVLGHGGFGITYLGWDRKLNRPVAVKEYFPRDCATRTPNDSTVIPTHSHEEDFYTYGLKQFLTEAETLAKFTHPNIVRIYEHIVENGTAYMVMEYVEGHTLSEILDQTGPMAPKQAVSLLLSILNGLKEVHNLGFLHRDIKPSNIYVRKSGAPLLIDFGASKYALGHHSRSITSVVAPGYSPFEQYATSGNQGPWTDIYACGATLYKMLTGIIPQEAPERVINDYLKSVRQINPQVSQTLSDVVMDALSVKPDDRIKSVSQLGNGLYSALTGSKKSSSFQSKPYRPPTSTYSTSGSTRPIKSGTPRTRPPRRGTSQTTSFMSVPSSTDKKKTRGINLLVFSLLGMAALGLSYILAVTLGWNIPTANSKTAAHFLVNKVDTVITAGQRFSFTPRVIGDRSDLNFSSTNVLPTGFMINQDDGRIEWIPKENQEGNHVIQIKLEDRQGTADDFVFAVAVQVPGSPNQAPQISVAQSSYNVQVGQALTIPVNASDPNNDDVQITVNPLPEGASYSNNQIRWTPDAGAVGSYTITAIASDGKLSAQASYQVTVSASSQPMPTITAAELRQQGVDSYNRGLELVNDGYVSRGVQAFEDAREYFEQSLELEPRNQDAITNLANTHYFIGSLEFNEAISTPSDSRREEKLDHAIDHLRSSIDIKPSFMDPYLQLAFSYHMKGNYNMALLYLDEYKNSEDSELDEYHYHAARGWFVLGLGQIDDAINECKDAVEFMSVVSADAIMCLAVSYLKKATIAYTNDDEPLAKRHLDHAMLEFEKVCEIDKAYCRDSFEQIAKDPGAFYTENERMHIMALRELLCDRATKKPSTYGQFSYVCEGANN